MIAHYLLMHLNSLEQLTIKKVIDDVRVLPLKASLTKIAFFSKGGYESFKDLITILDEEVKQKKCLILIINSIVPIWLGVL